MCWLFWACGYTFSGERSLVTNCYEVDHVVAQADAKPMTREGKLNEVTWEASCDQGDQHDQCDQCSEHTDQAHGDRCIK